MIWLVRRWEMFWFQPANAGELGIYRIAFYGCLFLDQLNLELTSFAAVSDLWQPTSFFAILTLPAPSSTASLLIVERLWKASLLLSCAGLMTRFSSAIAAVLSLLVLGLPNQYGSVVHTYAAVAVVCCVLALAPAGDGYSIDALLRKLVSKHPVVRIGSQYRWPIQAVRVLVVSVFVAAAISKLRRAGLSWVTDTNLQTLLIERLYIVQDLHLRPVTEFLARHPRACTIAAATTLALELSTPLMFASRRLALCWTALLAAFIVVLRGVLGPDFTPLLYCLLFWIPMPARLQHNAGKDREGVCDEWRAPYNRGVATSTPRVSVIIAAYRSQATIGRCLQTIEQQSWRDFETIVVDSSPDDETGRVVRRSFPAVQLLRSDTRLKPQAARSRGIPSARGDLLVFIDSDMYAHPDWLRRLVNAHDHHGGVAVGAIACFGSRLIDTAAHICKFAKWLPWGERRQIEMSPAANMLVSRIEFERVGGFTRGEFLGDVVLSRALRANNVALMFEPDAVAEHHHGHTLRSFLEERFHRGSLFGELRSQWLGGRASVLFYLLVTVVPVRLFRIAFIVAKEARRGLSRRWILPYPVAMLGHAAWLAGESVGYARALKWKRSEGRRDNAVPSATN